MSDMQPIDDGGPAFPPPILVSSGVAPMDLLKIGASIPAGMSLRDYFAAHALVAAYRMHMDGTRNVDRDAAALASECYAISDAMLAERKRGR